MKRVIHRKKSGYALGFALCLVGVIMLFAVLWKAWPNVSTSQDVLSALMSYLWAEQLNFGGIVGVQLMYLAITGTSALVVGSIILLLSRQVFTVSTAEDVLLRCPYCKNKWKATRALGHAECPHCRHFVQPTAIKIKR